ncbi:hypothetical protein [Neisseria perflava]|uniref:hypothetical protein n=1 Tax=Neisseria perflava TaxID=33053 RepID=UPI00209FA10B|nr:hypothetical protein [Neisseria perflava]
MFLSAEDIKSSNIEKEISNQLQKQYLNISYSDFKQSNNCTILIDDFDKLKLNNSAKDKLLNQLTDTFKKVIITATDSFKYILPDLNGFDKFNRHELRLLGYQRREELIKKWISLGIEDSISDSDLYDSVCDLSEKLKIIISNNIVPSKPIYLIIFLQMRKLLIPRI